MASEKDTPPSGDHTRSSDGNKKEQVKSVWSQGGDRTHVHWSLPSDMDDDDGKSGDVIDRVLREGTKGQRISRVRIQHTVCFMYPILTSSLVFCISFLDIFT